jgi:RNase H-fold protein (predicted Holliday junction resolvase)
VIPAPAVTVLGLDPGTRKCGIAVLRAAGSQPTLEIVPIEALAGRLRAIVAETPVDVAAVGRGTNAAAICATVRALGLNVELVDEHETTLLARARYFADHPPRGWRRLVPRGMLLPPRPIDDYAALLIAERYLKGR